MSIQSIGLPIILAFAFSFCLFDEGVTPTTPIDMVTPETDRISGITMVAPPDSFSINPMPSIIDVNASWISLVPYAYTPIDKPKVYYNSFGIWWGETPEGIIESAKLAHEQGLKIMLKPQVYIPNGWVGDMTFESEENWIIWEKEYRKYIFEMVNIANKSDIEMLCIGTEFRLVMEQREQFWRDLVIDIRKVYDGKIIYSSNWDTYKNVPIWDILDYIGVSSYFPLSESITPTVSELSQAWKPIIKDLKQVSKKFDKSVVFTEYGYLSVDQCAHQCWILEKKVKKIPINEQAQANALEALYTNLLQEDFWAGGFLWKWFPNDKGDEGYIPRDYTPQHKLSEQVVREWYNKF